MILYWIVGLVCFALGFVACYLAMRSFDVIEWENEEGDA